MWPGSCGHAASVGLVDVLLEGLRQLVGADALSRHVAHRAPAGQRQLARPAREHGVPNPERIAPSIYLFQITAVSVLASGSRPLARARLALA